MACSRLRLVLCLATALQGAGRASAQDPPATPADSCDRFGGYELRDCLQAQLAGADTGLNAAYAKALGVIRDTDGLSPDQKAAWHDDLRAAQRAWLAFRDADCKTDLIGAEWQFGSGTSAAQQHCVLTLTRARTKELLDRYPPS